MATSKALQFSAARTGMESRLRSLEHVAEKEQAAIERKEKELEDYKGQLNRHFEQEEKLRELLLEQQEMNKKLDLDKGEMQVMAEAE